MNLRMVFTIFRKELLDMARDRRALLMVLGVPVAMHPILFLFAGQVAISQLTKIDSESSRVAISQQADPQLSEWLKGIPKIQIVEAEDPEAAIKAGDADAAVAVDGDLADALAQGKSAALTIQFNAPEPASNKARDRLEDGLAERNDTLRKQRLDAVQLTEAYITPLSIESKNIATAAETAGSFLGRILPLLLIVMLGVGAFYPAIDLTVGEKERGTLETLLTSPVEKLELVTGKYLTVLTLSLTSGVLNLISMTLTLAFQFSQISSDALPMEIHVPPLAFAAILLTLIPLAMLVSACMMAAAMLARSQKEAEYYLTPIMIGMVFPGIFAIMPGAELGPFSQFVPVTNAALLCKDLLIEKASLLHILIVPISTTVYAALAIQLAAWLFQREDIILGGASAALFTRRKGALRFSLTPSEAFAFFVVMTIIVGYLGSAVQAWHLHAGLVITEWGLILLPVLWVIWFARINPATALSLRMPALRGLLGSIVMGTGMVFLVIQFTIWYNALFPIPEALTKAMEKVVGGESTNMPLVGLLAIIALSPAICEEFMFRGLILSALRRNMTPLAAVALTGVLFGVFHMNVHRMFLTGLVGLGIGYAAVRTNSLLPAIVVHFINNAFGVLSARGALPGPLERVFSDPSIEYNGLPGWLLACALMTVALGVLLIESAARSRVTGSRS